MKTKLISQYLSPFVSEWMQAEFQKEQKTMINAVHVGLLDLTVSGCTAVNPAPSCSHSSCCNSGIGQEAGCVSKRFLVVVIRILLENKKEGQKILATPENPRMWMWTEDFSWDNKLFCFIKLKHQKKMKFFYPSFSYLIMTHWFSLSMIMFLYMLSARA